MKVYALSRQLKWFLPLFAMINAFSSLQVQAANPADWKTFTSTGKRNWSVATNWTDATGIPTPGSSLVINFDPSRTGTVTSSGKISNSFEVTNDLGTVQLNTLNLAGESNGSARIITIRDGILQFAGDAPAINNTTTGTVDTVKYQLNNALLLDSNLTLNMNGTSEMTLLYGAGNTLSANSAGLKTITASGAGKCNLGGNATAVISDGVGQVGIIMAGTGTLVMGGANTFTGGTLINSGTVSINSTTAGTSTALGLGSVILGDSTGSADATLQLKNNVKYTNNIVVQAGSTGSRTILNAGGSQNLTLLGLITVNKTLRVQYTGGVSGGITFGDSTAAYLTGAEEIILDSNATAGSGHTLLGNNPGFTGNMTVNSGELILKSDTALSPSNKVSVAAGGMLKLYAKNQSIAGLSDVSNGGGVVTNTSLAVTLTLGGGGIYSFSGSIQNMALSVALTSNGSQTLGGDNIYTGATTVTSGTLLVNGSLAAGSVVTVGTNGTLGGSGIVRGPTTVNGTLAPGGSDRGTLTFGGNAIFSEKAKYNWDYIGGTGDVVSVTGNLQLPASATVNVSVATRVPTQPSVLFQAGSLSGSGATTVSGWTVTDGYSVAIQGTSILLMPPPDPRTMILVR